MNKLSLSIIFLCHNNRNIDICLDSVIEQTYVNDEIIVVDDHSNDETLALLKKYVENEKIFLLRSNKVANRSYNRNLGAKNAKNEVLVFLDGDMVLGNKGLLAIRTAHSLRLEQAFIGQKHAINFDELQLHLFSHIDNYIDLLKTQAGREQLAENLLFQDKRRFSFNNNENNNYNWTLYYTGLCTITKEIFDELNGFDENFTTWGSEDVDLGFRINQKYSIGYLNELHGFHIPHPRNVIKNEISNKNNIKYMLDKYKTWEFEILDSFYGYGSLPVFNNIIQRMRLVDVSESSMLLNDEELLIDIISKKYPKGNIYYQEKGKKQTVNSMLGVSILKKDKCFRVAYVSDHIFIYPPLLTCRILQEAIRIAENVYIYPTNDSTRFPWEEENMLLPKVQKQHYQYEVNDLFSFLFTPFEEYIKVTYISELLQ